MTLNDPLPLPQDDPTPPVDDAPDEMPDDREALRQDAPGEEGPAQQASGSAQPIARGPSAQAVGGYTGGMAAGDEDAVGMRQIVADEAEDARAHGHAEESPANEAQADV